MSLDFTEWLQSEIVTLDAVIEKQEDRGASPATVAKNEETLTRLLVAWDVVLEHDRWLKAQGVSGS